MTHYLRIGNDCLDQAMPHSSRAAAIRSYEVVATELDRYGQRIDASIHIARSLECANEYPDFMLSIGPRGGIRCDRT